MDELQKAYENAKKKFHNNHDDGDLAIADLYRAAEKEIQAATKVLENTIIAQAKYIQWFLDEVIGNDEPLAESSIRPIVDYKALHRNKLRQQMRDKLRGSDGKNL